MAKDRKPLDPRQGICRIKLAQECGPAADNPARFGGSEISVLIFFALNCSAKTPSFSWPSEKLVAHRTRLSLATVKRAISNLIDGGLIVRKKRGPGMSLLTILQWTTIEARHDPGLYRQVWVNDEEDPLAADGVNDLDDREQPAPAVPVAAGREDVSGAMLVLKDFFPQHASMQIASFVAAVKSDLEKTRATAGISGEEMRLILLAQLHLPAVRESLGKCKHMGKYLAACFPSWLRAARTPNPATAKNAAPAPPVDVPVPSRTAADDRATDVDDLLTFLRECLPEHPRLSNSPANRHNLEIVEKVLGEYLDLGGGDVHFVGQMIAENMSHPETQSAAMKVKDLGSHLRVCLAKWAEDTYDRENAVDYQTNNGTYDDGTHDDPDEEPARNDGRSRW
jgi:hypothetical protein